MYVLKFYMFYFILLGTQKSFLKRTQEIKFKFSL